MKKLLIGLLVAATVLFAFAGCEKSQPEATKEAAQTAATTAPTLINFQDLTWVRETSSCTETIRFYSDGSCSYFCSCGNPVNDDDLCEGYRYDPENQTILLLFEVTTPETVTQITVQSCDGKTLVLDFAGDVRTFRLQA